MTSAFPLSWPDGWPRTPAHQRKDASHKFTKASGGPYGRRSITIHEASTRLISELEKLGARGVTISSNLKLNNDGSPRSRQTIPDDVGIAVFFELEGPKVMARDAFSKPEHNLNSIAIALEGMRQLQRHGGGFMFAKAFDGFSALPPPDAKKTWRSILGFSETGRVTSEDAKQARNNLAKLYFEAGLKPDPVRMRDIVAAYEESKAETI